MGSSKINDFKILFWVLIGIPLVASTNIDCGGKSFHCVNSTHFMICVDFGGAVSTTVDNFVIPCPPPATCSRNNRFECEFLKPAVAWSTASTPIPSVQTTIKSVTNESEISASTPSWEEISISTTFPYNTSAGNLEIQNNTFESITESFLMKTTTAATSVNFSVNKTIEKPVSELIITEFQTTTVDDFLILNETFNANANGTDVNFLNGTAVLRTRQQNETNVISILTPKSIAMETTLTPVTPAVLGSVNVASNATKISDNKGRNIINATEGFINTDWLLIVNSTETDAVDRSTVPYQSRENVITSTVVNQTSNSSIVNGSTPISSNDYQTISVSTPKSNSVNSNVPLDFITSAPELSTGTVTESVINVSTIPIMKTTTKDVIPDINNQSTLKTGDDTIFNRTSFNSYTPTSELNINTTAYLHDTKDFTVNASVSTNSTPNITSQNSLEGVMTSTNQANIMTNLLVHADDITKTSALPVFNATSTSPKSTPETILLEPNMLVEDHVTSSTEASVITTAYVEETTKTPNATTFITSTTAKATSGILSQTSQSLIEDVVLTTESNMITASIAEFLASIFNSTSKSAREIPFNSNIARIATESNNFTIPLVENFTETAIVQTISNYDDNLTLNSNVNISQNEVNIDIAKETMTIDKSTMTPTYVSIQGENMGIRTTTVIPPVTNRTVDNNVTSTKILIENDQNKEELKTTSARLVHQETHNQNNPFVPNLVSGVTINNIQNVTPTPASLTTFAPEVYISNLLFSSASTDSDNVVNSTLPTGTANLESNLTIVKDNTESVDVHKVFDASPINIDIDSNGAFDFNQSLSIDLSVSISNQTFDTHTTIVPIYLKTDGGSSSNRSELSNSIPKEGGTSGSASNSLNTDVRTNKNVTTEFITLSLNDIFTVPVSSVSNKSESSVQPVKTADILPNSEFVSNDVAKDTTGDINNSSNTVKSILIEEKLPVETSNKSMDEIINNAESKAIKDERPFNIENGYTIRVPVIYLTEDDVSILNNKSSLNVNQPTPVLENSNVVETQFINETVMVKNISNEKPNNIGAPKLSGDNITSVIMNPLENVILNSTEQPMVLETQSQKAPANNEYTEGLPWLRSEDKSEQVNGTRPERNLVSDTVVIKSEKSTTAPTTTSEWALTSLTSSFVSSSAYTTETINPNIIRSTAETQGLSSFYPVATSTSLTTTAKTKNSIVPTISSVKETIKPVYQPTTESSTTFGTTSDHPVHTSSVVTSEANNFDSVNINGLNQKSESTTIAILSPTTDTINKTGQQTNLGATSAWSSSHPISVASIVTSVEEETTAPKNSVLSHSTLTTPKNVTVSFLATRINRDDKRSREAEATRGSISEGSVSKSVFSPTLNTMDQAIKIPQISASITSETSTENNLGTNAHIALSFGGSLSTPNSYLAEETSDQDNQIPTTTTSDSFITSKTSKLDDSSILVSTSISTASLVTEPSELDKQTPKDATSDVSTTSKTNIQDNLNTNVQIGLNSESTVSASIATSATETISQGNQIPIEATSDYSNTLKTSIKNNLTSDAQIGLTSDSLIPTSISSSTARTIDQGNQTSTEATPGSRITFKTSDENNSSTNAQIELRSGSLVPTSISSSATGSIDRSHQTQTEATSESPTTLIPSLQDKITTNAQIGLTSDSLASTSIASSVKKTIEQGKKTTSDSLNTSETGKKDYLKSNGPPGLSSSSSVSTSITSPATQISDQGKQTEAKSDYLTASETYKDNKSTNVQIGQNFGSSVSASIATPSAVTITQVNQTPIDGTSDYSNTLKTSIQDNLTSDAQIRLTSDSLFSTLISPSIAKTIDQSQTSTEATPGSRITFKTSDKINSRTNAQIGLHSGSLVSTSISSSATGFIDRGHQTQTEAKSESPTTLIPSLKNNITTNAQIGLTSDSLASTSIASSATKTIDRGNQTTSDSSTTSEIGKQNYLRSNGLAGSSSSSSVSPPTSTSAIHTRDRLNQTLTAATANSSTTLKIDKQDYLTTNSQVGLSSSSSVSASIASSASETINQGNQIPTETSSKNNNQGNLNTNSQIALGSGSLVPTLIASSAKETINQGNQTSTRVTSIYSTSSKRNYQDYLTTDEQVVPTSTKSPAIKPFDQGKMTPKEANLKLSSSTSIDASHATTPKIELSSSITVSTSYITTSASVKTTNQESVRPAKEKPGLYFISPVPTKTVPTFTSTEKNKPLTAIPATLSNINQVTRYSETVSEVSSVDVITSKNVDQDNIKLKQTIPELSLAKTGHTKSAPNTSATNNAREETNIPIKTVLRTTNVLISTADSENRSQNGLKPNFTDIRPVTNDTTQQENTILYTEATLLLNPRTSSHSVKATNKLHSSKIPDLIFTSPAPVTIALPRSTKIVDNGEVTSETTIKNFESSSTKAGATTASNTTPLPVNKNIKNTKVQNTFNCEIHMRGKYSDNKNCRKFYICIGIKQPIEGLCPVNTVFSEINRQCTKNLSHCIRGNEFKCVSDGRFSDFLNNNVYYICVQNRKQEFIRFKFQCQKGYTLNKTTIRCVQNARELSNQSVSVSNDSDTANNSNRSLKNQTKQKTHLSERSVKQNTKEKSKSKRKESFECEKEGKFEDPSNCRRYYVCSKSRRSEEYRQRRKSCDSDEVFHKNKKKCVDAESYECS